MVRGEIRVELVRWTYDSGVAHEGQPDLIPETDPASLLGQRPLEDIDGSEDGLLDLDEVGEDGDQGGHGHRCREEGHEPELDEEVRVEGGRVPPLPALVLELDHITGPVSEVCCLVAVVFLGDMGVHPEQLVRIVVMAPMTIT